MNAIIDQLAFGGIEAKYDCSNLISGNGGITGRRGFGRRWITEGEDGEDGDDSTSTGIFIEAAVEGLMS